MPNKEKEKDVQEIEFTPDAAKAVAEAVKGTVEESVNSKVAEAVQPLVAQMETLTKALEALEPNVNKNIGGGTSKENAGEPTKESQDGKEKKFMKAAIALINNDVQALKSYNEAAIESRTKAGYANTDVNADGGYIVMDPEFEAEIEKLAPLYGVAFEDASVRVTDRDSIKTNKRGSNVVMYETSQGGQKQGTKLVIDQITVELRKFAAIAVATDELVEDAAIDFWADVAEGFAEERARIADELVFTDDDATTPGILHAEGTAAISVGATISLFNWDDLLDAEVSVPTRAMQNGKHYMHRTVWNIVRKNKDDEGRYMLMPTAGLQTPWGTPVRLVDVLPAASVVGDSNEPYAVFGDLKRVKLYTKRGLVLSQSNEATVHDADGNAVNLWEKDMSALRAVTRMVALVKFPEAFCIIGTGTVS